MQLVSAEQLRCAELEYTNTLEVCVTGNRKGQQNSQITQNKKTEREVSMTDTSMNQSTDLVTSPTAEYEVQLSSPPVRTGELAPAVGKTTIQDTVVARIVDLAAREVSGVHDLTPLSTRAAISGMASGLASRITGGDTRGQGVNVVVGQREAAVDMAMAVDYGVNIPQLAEAVRRNIMGRVAAMTNLTVKEVNIQVTDLYFPQMEEKRPARVE
jgi:uncharacterized alkaline shock family protein YloU